MNSLLEIILENPFQYNAQHYTSEAYVPYFSTQ